MFEMFEREGWTPEDRRAFIVRKFHEGEDIAAAE